MVAAWGEVAVALVAAAWGKVAVALVVVAMWGKVVGARVVAKMVEVKGEEAEYYCKLANHHMYQLMHCS